MELRHIHILIQTPEQCDEALGALMSEWFRLLSLGEMNSSPLNPGIPAAKNFFNPFQRLQTDFTWREEWRNLPRTMQLPRFGSLRPSTHSI
jgi:hypothetical protein